VLLTQMPIELVCTHPLTYEGVSHIGQGHQS